jgi:hypothetical protein
MFVEKIYKMQHLGGSGKPVLNIERTVLKGYTAWIPPKILPTFLHLYFLFSSIRFFYHFALSHTSLQRSLHPNIP